MERFIIAVVASILMTGISQTWAFDQSQGFYAKGALQYADHLPDVGPGFMKLFVPRDRRYSNSAMIEVIESVATFMNEQFPDGERLQIGDQSAEVGGEISGHDSHQNGLDADIAYFRVNRHEQDPMVTTGFVENFVSRKTVTANFDLKRNWELIKAFVDHAEVNRMFVDPVIKHALCNYARKVGEYSSHIETLRKLRPLENHQDHVHLRIQCPEGNPHCEAQAPPPAGSGCSAAEIDSPPLLAEHERD